MYYIRYSYTLVIDMIEHYLIEQVYSRNQLVTINAIVDKTLQMQNTQLYKVTTNTNTLDNKILNLFAKQKMRYFISFNMINNIKIIKQTN